MRNPLEQFTIIPIIGLDISYIDISITNVTFVMMIAFATYKILFDQAKMRIIPKTWQNLIEMIYNFIYNMIIEQIGKIAIPYLPIVLTIFMFILMSNLIGTIPYGFTTTTQMIITFALSITLFIGITIIGFLNHGLAYFSILLPSGTSLVLAPILVLVELISYLAKAVSLAVRLFANMLAGHTLLKIIASFIYPILYTKFAILTLIPLMLLTALVGLEMGVAILQAYVFTILICFYLKDAILLH